MNDDLKPINRPKKNKPGKVGRPRIEIDLNQLEMLGMYGATEQEIGDFFKTSAMHIARVIKAEYHQSFVEFRRSQAAKMKYRLVNKVMKIINWDLEKTQGRINTPLLIFVLKNLCGWKEKMESTGDQSITLSTPRTVYLEFNDEPQEKVIDIESSIENG